MTKKIVARMRTGKRVDTRPDAELELFASLVAFPTFGSLFASWNKTVRQAANSSAEEILEIHVPPADAEDGQHPASPSCRGGLECAISSDGRLRTDSMCCSSKIEIEECGGKGEQTEKGCMKRLV